MRRVFLILAMAGAASLAAGPLPAQSRSAAGCELCHGEMEFLRAQTGSLADAERLYATAALARGSAHDGMECGECHSGFARFPHGGGAATRSCASCHDEVRQLWQQGVHADPISADIVSCASCHGVHDVMGPETIATEAGMGRLNAHCTACHESSRPALGDPHAQAVPCAGCHAPHDTRRVDDQAARVAPAHQHETCGACHAEDVEGWTGDAHGVALRDAGYDDSAGGHQPPACTACHGAHNMLAKADPGFPAAMLGRCSECHEHEAETYLETYHGQASALGSEIVATCGACHGNHDIRSASDPASAVAEANLIATCGSCHEQARASFVEYDPHPDPGDRERSAVLYWAFFFMNALLIGVFSVFGVHTILWWVRLVTGRQDGGGEKQHG